MMDSSQSVGVATPGRRGRRRSLQADEAILSATREILVTLGSSGFSIKEVVERSGVSTATIYRRWPTAHDLILEGMRSLVPEPVPIDAGSLEADITAFVYQFGDALLSVAGLYAADRRDSGTDPRLREEIRSSFVELRLQLLRAILGRAQEKGELGSLPVVEECWDFVAGPIHHRLLIRGESFTEEYVARASAVIVAGLTALSKAIDEKDR
jgi:AcrR family transcriptional regulator